VKEARRRNQANFAQFKIGWVNPEHLLNGPSLFRRILLFLYYKKVLSRPMFYLSAFFENNRDEYYLRLREARGHMPAVLVFPKLLEIAEDKQF
jgi:hypothetical protein